ncbi:CDP-glycerol glycerophosphotransferase family protein [Methanoculleus sp.]|uniref:CDP-glycerol glycerophosphotransferase family protein n=1 Tax=Methanoculleus sp. TaxID=90427 RepID=UPI001BD5E24A|nr:CDP-glycerol glycerophosphotransferase family protein [Methanoculleus sp.]
MISRGLVNDTRSLAYDIATLVSSTLSRFIPKDEHKILFFSAPDFSDNARYVYDRMLESGLDRTHQLIWCVYSPVQANHVIRRSREYLYHALTAKYIISTHGTPTWKSKNQISVELWHGLPLKTIGYFADIGYPNAAARLSATWRLRRFASSVDYLITTSEFERLIFSSAFLIDPGRVLVRGQPRCDALYRPRDSGIDALCRILSRDDIVDKRILLYLPTFREYDADASRRVLEEILASEKFRRFVKDENLLFVCKPHSHDEGLFQAYNREHIHILLNDDLRRAGNTIYDFLNAVDILVTDYSSVYFDFLHLNRPIVFHVPDIEDYRKQRGFILEPFRDWAPGESSNNVDELIGALASSLADPDRWETERVRIRRLTFRYADDLACERVCRLIEQR